MVGYVATVVIVTAGMLLSIAPLARSGAWGTASWLLSALVNESPSLGFVYLCLATTPALFSDEPPGPEVVAWFLLGCASFLGAPVLLSRSFRARDVLDRALGEALGDGPGGSLGDGHLQPGHGAPALPSTWRRRPPWLRIAVLPVPVLPRGVRVRRRLRYGPSHRQRLDLYRASGSGTSTGRPILIHLHGGGFRTGRKSVYARPLLHAFARHGWVCVSASYRLRPARYPDILSDVKRVIVWSKEHAADIGADPQRIVLAGSSAGAHLALTAALTADLPAFQPGFESNDTGVAAAVGLYGYYGGVDSDGPPSRPADYAHPAAPPVMIVHGDQDTLLPPRAAAHLADTLRATPRNPVVYAQLPGAQHTFDLLHSLRFELVIDALWTFCTRVTR
ncbi:acetyl esterase/lipase [Humibacillus xanthopallidus]|uniref:Acetyl esterase/lipase n=1 Tax=Humibacillus xanthopallidus TaxID=412689 RepID=A0A543PWT2_9MICO|nr:alpha/beta hydrolase [Humibacillus xanthopallidus]TQN48516.1 acetyl esterase/lipase [Humibacillus xanthopallidus]